MSGPRRAFLIGGGIGSLAAAAFMIRDGGLKGSQISVFEAMPVTLPRGCRPRPGPRGGCSRPHRLPGWQRGGAGGGLCRLIVPPNGPQDTPLEPGWHEDSTAAVDRNQWDPSKVSLLSAKSASGHPRRFSHVRTVSVQLPTADQQCSPGKHRDGSLSEQPAHHRRSHF